MAKRPGVYLFEAGAHEDIFANDGKLANDEFMQARRILASFQTLSFAATCSIFPIHYEEDLVQEERRRNFVIKDWVIAALVMKDNGELSKALIINLDHHDEGFLVDLLSPTILVAFYRGFDIREFIDVPVQTGNEFLSSIGIAEEEYAVSSDYLLDEDDEEAPIIEVEKPHFVANSKKKIINFGGVQIQEETPLDNEEDEEIEIVVDRPSFQAGKKNRIANLGSSFSQLDEEDDDVVILVSRPSFQAGNSKKPRNLDAKPDWVKKAPIKEAPEHIEVERPNFVAGKKGKIRNIVDEKKPVQPRIEKKAEPTKPNLVEKPSFVPNRQGGPTNLHAPKMNKTVEVVPAGFVAKKAPKKVEETPVIEERNWVYTDVFKLKPRVFQGERAILHDPKEKRDERFFLEAYKELEKLSSIRISKNCVFVPSVLPDSDPHFRLIENFKASEWDELAITLNKDEKVLYVFLANKVETDFAILVSFKHKGPHIVVISNKGGAIDDRALPYYSYKDLRSIVFGK